MVVVVVVVMVVMVVVSQLFWFPIRSPICYQI
ncbi:hypothetical protein QR98_0006960, partial [Sarcoptes scabiei]